MERLGFASPCQLTSLLQTKTDLDAKSLGLAIIKTLATELCLLNLVPALHALNEN